MEGTQIGTYVIERMLGQGGFGVVYVAVDARLGRRAAIKQLLPELSGHREIVERFFNEAKAAASINHPGIVEIYDVGWHTDGSAYFAMKLLDGDSLAKRLRATGPLPVHLAATIARQVASALAAAHARGIVHRDLKPDNIILVADDEVAIGERAVVLDFGIAKLGGDGKALSQKTRTGMMMGTPSYMSPEQCRGAGEVDHRTDVYALGCILFEMLAGRPPFVGEGPGEVLGMHQFVEPPALRSLRADAPPDLAALVMRMLAKKPDQRPAQMSEITGALQAFATGGRTSERAVAAPSASAMQMLAQPTPIPSTMSAAGGEVVTAPITKKSKLPLVLAIGAVAVVGIVVAVVLSSSSTSAPMAAKPPADAAVATATPDAPARAIDAAVAVAPPDARDVAKLVADLEHMIAERKWDDAIAQAALISTIESNDKAKALSKKAYAESKAELATRELASAALKGDATAARAAYDKIPDDSVYKAEAKAQKAQLDKHIADDKRVAEDKRLAEHKRAEAAKPADPDPQPSIDKLIVDASSAARAGQYAQARHLAEQALQREPGNQQAVTVAAIASCNLKDAFSAKRYIAMLSEARKGMARQICLRNNVTVDD